MRPPLLPFYVTMLKNARTSSSDSLPSGISCLARCAHEAWTYLLLDTIHTISPSRSSLSHTRQAIGTIFPCFFLVFLRCCNLCLVRTNTKSRGVLLFGTTYHHILSKLYPYIKTTPKIREPSVRAKIPYRIEHRLHHIGHYFRYYCVYSNTYIVHSILYTLKVKYVEHEYASDLAITQLSVEELQKYIHTLGFYLRHMEDRNSLADSIDNAISFSDVVDGLNEGYTEDQVPVLAEIARLLEENIPSVTDKALGDLLQENLQKIKVFLNGIEKDTETPAHPSYDCKKIGKSMGKEMKKLPQTELSNDWRHLAEEIASNHLSPKKESAKAELDEFILKSVERLKERERESKQRFNVYPNQKVELSKPMTMNELLRKLGERIAHEGMGHT